MKYYLAGPMTGLDGYNYPAFQEAATVLRHLGYSIVSPTEGHGRAGEGENIGSEPYANYYRRNLQGLIQCEAIIFMPGWLTSEGAVVELLVARRLDMEVFTLDVGYNNLKRMY